MTALAKGAIIVDIETENSMKLTQRERMVKARVTMLLKQPFFGSIATRLRLVEDKEIRTAATNGRDLIFNPDFTATLNDAQLVFLVGHEVGHCIFDHLTRRGDRDPQLWNMAGDYVINDMLIRNNIGERITQVPILWDAKYNEKWTADEVYKDLFDNAVKIQITLDDHIDMDGDGDSQEDENSKGANSKYGKKLSEEEKKALRDEMKDAILQAAQSAGAGNLPGQIKRMIQQFTAPKINWREMVRIQLESMIKNDYSWMRPSRKGWHTGAVLPGMLPSEKLDVAIAIDTSGSITNEMVQDFLGEVKGMLDMFDSYEVDVWCFDTSVWNHRKFVSDQGDDILTYEMEGGGGTDFMVNWAYMREQGIEPKQLIMFTDGEPWNEWGEPNYCDTLFVVHSNPKKVAPFGITTHYEDHHAK